MVRYIPFDYQELESGGNRKDKGGVNSRTGEDKILKMLRTKDSLILLDEAGLQYNSRGFAGWLGQQFTHGTSGDLVFVIGGPYGFSDEIKQKASLLLSLSKMTFTHQMVRPFLLEQIYRALTILRNESYHHD
jgi:23S rRNA (pseudouridine1915-N3)-methyltransferase